jgi:hypothetical protein
MLLSAFRHSHQISSGEMTRLITEQDSLKKFPAALADFHRYLV